MASPSKDSELGGAWKIVQPFTAGKAGDENFLANSFGRKPARFYFRASFCFANIYCFTERLERLCYVVVVAFIF